MKQLGDQFKIESRRWWKGRRVTVWGAGLSGVAAAKLAFQLGASVTLSDAQPYERLTHAHNLPSGIKTCFHSPNEIADAELIIPSPGIPPSHPIILEAQKQGIRLMSEIELGAQVTEAQIIAITGTDGKSTTTQLITEALQAQGLWAKAVGNIGDPICNWALEAPKEGFLVVEISAFQLWTTQYLNAVLAVITNIAQDHHDYFNGSAEAYRSSKLSLAYLIAKHGFLFYPQAILEMTEIESAQAKGHLNIQLCAYDVQAEAIVSPLLGRHNQLNLSVALHCIQALSLDTNKALERFQSFSPLPYRMTLSRTLHDVRYVNDSKATNVHAALTGIQSLNEPLIVITGGYDKGLELTSFIEVLSQKARVVLTIGQTGNQISQALKPFKLESLYCETLERAIQKAQEYAQPGDTVILSPAASSFDQFKSFEDRGETFDRLVASLS